MWGKLALHLAVCPSADVVQVWRKKELSTEPCKTALCSAFIGRKPDTRAQQEQQGLHPSLYMEGLCSFHSDSLGSLPKQESLVATCLHNSRFSFLFFFYQQAHSCLHFHIVEEPNRSKEPVTCQCTLAESEDLIQYLSKSWLNEQRDR